MFQVSRIDIPNKDNVKVIYLAGEVDGDSVEDFKEQLGAIFKATPEVDYYILHLQKLDFINSMIIGYLADSYTKLGKEGKKIILSEGNTHILDILDLVGFTNLVEHHESLREAIASTEL